MGCIGDKTSAFRCHQRKDTVEYFNASNRSQFVRIEAVSYLCVGAITNGKIKVNQINPNHIKTEITILRKIGYKVLVNENSIILLKGNKLKPVKIKTGPWPSLATDNMPMIMAVLTKVPGKSQIEEKIFSNRFMAAPELNRMEQKFL